jgi:hypothetical protein
VKLTHPKFDYQFEFNDFSVYELVVENKELLQKLALDFTLQSDEVMVNFNFSSTQKNIYFQHRCSQ